MADKAPSGKAKKRAIKVYVYGTHNPPDHPHEILRKAIQDAVKYVGVQKMLEIQNEYFGYEVMKRDGFELFIDNVTRELSPKNYEVLTDVWLRSIQGRMLRFIDPSKKLPAFDRLGTFLASGKSFAPNGQIFTGNFFMYHGSYSWTRGVAIRAVSIQCTEQNLFNVVDKVIDREAPGEAKVAEGILTFATDKPQILLHSDENKVGLSLMIGMETELNKATNEVMWIAGMLFAVTKGNKVTERRFRLVRESVEKFEQMVEQTGAFEFHEIRAGVATDKGLDRKIAPKHLEECIKLARRELSLDTADPILNFNS